MHNRKRNIRFNKLKRLTEVGLSSNVRKQNTYQVWAAEHYKHSKYSQMEDLPSSQLPSKASLITNDRAQLFVVIDTCSIIGYREKFLSFVIRQKRLFPVSPPIRFILTVPVLEELDSHSKRNKRKRAQVKEEGPPATENNNELKIDADLINIVTRVSPDIHTPRYLLRIIEEETRMNGVLVSDLDPGNKTKLVGADQDYEIVNNDDRILHRCLVARKFISDVSHHEDTKVILVAEDNILKIKATTRGIVSYRWAEFECKYKNFGLKNCSPTPLVRPNMRKLRDNNGSIVSNNVDKRSQQIDKEDDIIFIEEIIKLKE